MLTDDMITVLIHSRGTECDQYRWLCVYLWYYCIRTGNVPDSS